jgi:p21-activated kinase 1
MSLGMVSATSSPRLPQMGGGAPTSFRSPPIQTPSSFDTFDPNSHMLPSRAAPAPPGLMRRDSNQPVTPTPQQTLGAGPSRPYTKSASNSPNLNRYSAGASSSPLPPMANGPNGANGIPPPRPTRAGTMPYVDSGQNGLQPISATQALARGNPSVLSPASGSNFLTQPPPPPLPHQPYSSPNNPYSVQGIEKGIEDTKLGQGMGMPMNVVEPTKEKELPNAPNAATRSRSGTGKSQKGKSIFGLSFSGTSSVHLLLTH